MSRRISYVRDERDQGYADGKREGARMLAEVQRDLEETRRERDSMGAVVRDIRATLRREREESLAVHTVAVAIMRECNEAPRCPFCVEDDDHDPDQLCGKLEAALSHR